MVNLLFEQLERLVKLIFDQSAVNHNFSIDGKELRRNLNLYNDCRQSRQLEVQLGNMLVFLRRICSSRQIREAIGQKDWIQLILDITSEHPETNLPQVSNLRTRSLSLSFLEVVLPNSSLDTELKEQFSRQIFLQLASSMWIMPAAQAHLKAGRLLFDLQKHLLRLSTPDLAEDLRPDSPENNLPIQEVGFDPDTCVWCSVEGGHTLVHGPGGRGYGLASSPIISGCYQWKFLIVKENRGNEGTCVGVSKFPVKDYSHRTTSDMWLYRAYSGNLYHNGELSVSLPSFTQGDYITVVLDMEAKTLSFGKNGEDLRLAFENIDATELYPCVMFYSTNPGEKVKIVDMQMRGSSHDLDPGDPLCAPQPAVMAESYISLLRKLHEDPNWTQQINDSIIERLSQTKDLLPSPKDNLLDLTQRQEESFETRSQTEEEENAEEEKLLESNEEIPAETTDAHGYHGTNKSQINLVQEMNLEQLTKEVWPALAVIGGVDSGLRIGGQCLQSSTGRKAMLLGALRKGHPTVKVRKKSEQRIVYTEIKS